MAKPTQEQEIARILHETHVSPIERLQSIFDGNTTEHLPSIKDVQAAFMAPTLYELHKHKPHEQRSIESKEGDPYSEEGQTIVEVWRNGSARIIKRRVLEFSDHNTTLNTTWTITYTDYVSTIRYQEDALNDPGHARDMSLIGTAKVINNKTGKELIFS